MPSADFPFNLAFLKFENRNKTLKVNGIYLQITHTLIGILASIATVNFIVVDILH